MAFTTGTANDIRDLLSRVRAFILTNGWDEVYWNGSTRLHVKGTGDNGYDEIYNSLYIFEDASTDKYHFRVYGALGMKGTSPNYYRIKSILQYCALWNNPMDYWLVCNGRRVIMYAKVSTKYAGLHFGLVRPFATPEQYPYPMVVGGTHYIRVSWTSNANTAWWDNREHVCAISADNRILENYVDVWPKEGASELDKMIDCMDGSYSLIPLIVVSNNTNTNSDSTMYAIGQVEGLYHVSGFNQSAENILTIGSDNYVVFPKFADTGRNDWVALQLK